MKCRKLVDTTNRSYAGQSTIGAVGPVLRDYSVVYDVKDENRLYFDPSLMCGGSCSER